MVKFLVMQLRLGKITLEQIPERYRDDVEKALQTTAVTKSQPGNIIN